MQANKGLQREVEIGAKIRHANLVQVYGIVQVGQNMCLVMEQMLDDSLGDRLKKTVCRFLLPALNHVALSCH